MQVFPVWSDWYATLAPKSQRFNVLSRANAMSSRHSKSHLKTRKARPSLDDRQQQSAIRISDKQSWAIIRERPSDHFSTFRNTTNKWRQASSICLKLWWKLREQLLDFSYLAMEKPDSSGMCWNLQMRGVQTPPVWPNWALRDFIKYNRYTVKLRYDQTAQARWILQCCNRHISKCQSQT